MTFSRRTFLQLSGVLAVGTVLPDWAAGFGGQFALAPDSDQPKLRALQAVPVFAQPDAGSDILQTLWPDSTHLAQRIMDGWIKLEAGWVQDVAMQPMISTGEAMAVSHRLPQIVTVQAPVAIVREWVGPDAPIVARIGFGGVLWARDHLMGDMGQDYIAVAESAHGPVLGWTMTERWAGIPEMHKMILANMYIRLNSQAQSISIWQDGDVLLNAAASSPSTITPGTYHITGIEPAMAVNTYQGAAWCLQSDGPAIYGAYWHNDFGQPGNGSGWEVMPWFSRNLARLAVVGTPVIVI